MIKDDDRMKRIPAMRTNQNHVVLWCNYTGKTASFDKNILMSSGKPNNLLVIMYFNMDESNFIVCKSVAIDLITKILQRAFITSNICS